MNIVCISSSQVPSSTANSIQVMKACQGLAQNGHTVHLLLPATNQPRPASPDMLSFYGLQTLPEIEWLPSLNSLKRYDFCWSAISRARQLGAEVVVVWPLQAALFGLLRSIPTILEMHGPPEGKLGPFLFRWFLRLKGKKRLLPISNALLELLRKDYALSPSICRVSPNGIDLEQYTSLPDSSSARHSLALPDGLTAGYTGHLYPGRGMNLLVQLAARFPKVRFLWVGGRAEDVNEWRQRLAEQGLQNVTLTGFVENSRLPLYQAAADILLMPYERTIAGSSGGNSASYASPMKMFEYMACGRAIISSDLPIIREVLDETSALLCPPEEIAPWAQALESLLNDPVKRQSWGAQARQKASQYTWQARARQALEGFS